MLENILNCYVKNAEYENLVKIIYELGDMGLISNPNEIVDDLDEIDSSNGNS